MFKDLKVLELASVLAGPSVGQFFAELGAEVIKIENLKTGGDVTRTWKGRGENTDDRSAYFCAVNWGKRSVALDLESPSDRAIVHGLVKNSDIVIASYKPGDAEKLSVDYKTFRSIKRDIIYGQITGYGSANQRVGYDAIIQAEAGFMFMNGEPGGASLKMPVALVDVLAAHHLKEALLLALIKRIKTNEGSFVEVSLIEAAISSLVNQATNWLIGGSLPVKQGSSHPNIAPYGDTFVTADQKEILLAVGNDRQFQHLCQILGIREVSADPLYMSNSARVVNRNSLHAILGKKIAGKTSSEFLKDCHKRNIPAGIIQNMQEVFNMNESQPVMLHAQNLRGIRTFTARGFSDRSVENILPPPHFGEHTNAVLQELARQI